MPLPAYSPQYRTRILASLAYYRQAEVFASQEAIFTGADKPVICRYSWADTERLSSSKTAHSPHGPGLRLWRQQGCRPLRALTDHTKRPDSRVLRDYRCRADHTRIFVQGHVRTRLWLRITTKPGIKTRRGQALLRPLCEETLQASCTRYSMLQQTSWDLFPFSCST